MKRALWQVSSFLLFVIALSSAVAEESDGGRLRIIPNPIVVGSPFQLVGVIDPEVLKKGREDGKHEIQCNITSRSFVQFMQPNVDVVIPSNLNAFKLEAIVLGCPETLPLTFNASFTCAAIKKEGTTADIVQSSKPDVVNMRALPGSSFDAVAQSVATDDEVVIRFSLENVVNHLTNEGVYCNLTWDGTVLSSVEGKAKLTTVWLDERGQNVSIESQDKDVCEASRPSSASMSPPPATKTSGCLFGDFIGHNSKTLVQSFRRSLGKKDVRSIDIDLQCFARGFDNSSCKVTAMRHTVSLPQPMSVKFNDPPSELTAGLDFDLRFSVTGVSGTTKCVIRFPTSDYHLKKSVASCAVISGTNAIQCDATEGDVRSLPVHVNSATKEGLAGITVSCDTASMHAFNDSMTVSILRNASLALNATKRIISTSKEFLLRVNVSNEGPSDVANILCTVQYDKELDPKVRKPKERCSVTAGMISCNLTQTLPGLSIDEKPSDTKISIEASSMMDESWYNTTYSFEFCCSFPATREQRKSICQTVNSSLIDLDHTKDNETPTAGSRDSSFWTYALVIVNLFLIALVVFVGMWLRNRAIAKSVQASQRVDHFTELESFSGARPLSKAE